jgi:hypothetical protein
MRISYVEGIKKCGVKRWLACGEGAVAAYFDLEKSCEIKGGSFCCHNIL